MRIRKSKDRQHNGQKKKKTIGHISCNDLQNNTDKAKVRVTRTPLKTGREFRCCRRVIS